MSQALDLDLALPGNLPAAEAERAQGIDCGGLAVALPYRWARQVVERFELSQVPRSPAWLAGAANVDGQVLPVIDLAAWAWPDRPPRAEGRERLLVGGDGDQALALRFHGLPVLLRAADGAAPASMPLTEFVIGSAQGGADARAWPLLDMARLAQALGDQLSAT